MKDHDAFGGAPGASKERAVVRLQDRGGTHHHVYGLSTDHPALGADPIGAFGR